jgi:tetratricopeptide (TPR) repeat protein
VHRGNDRSISRQPIVTPRWNFAISPGVLALACLCLFASSATFGEPPHAADAVTFSRDVAPIVFHNCAGCHHPGEAAPFSLLTYDDVRRHARQIVDVTEKRFMPPWLPTEGRDVFERARRLSDRDLQTLKQWVEAGMPAGTQSQTPAVPVFTAGWQTGTPDLVLESPAYTLSSQDRDVFRNFVIPIPLDAPRWVQSIELRPDNPRITHHARLGVDTSNESIRRNSEDKQPGYAGMAWAQDPDGQLVIWAPGMVAAPGTPGVAWRLFPNTCLVLHTHMQPSGKSEVMKFRIGLHFAKESPLVHPVMLRIGSCDIDIPAGAKHHVASDQYVLPIDVDVATIFPHAHSLCQQIHVVGELSNGSRQDLISIEHFDENWHDSYRYLKPVRLPRGTRLISTFVYDNTKENIRNRNIPPRRVVYGSNVTDEMADIYLQVTAARADQRAVLMEDYGKYDLQSQAIGYRKSLEAYPDNPWSKDGLATCYVGMGEPAKAITILEERVKTGPAAVYPVVSLGMALLAGNDLTQAESRFRQALTMDEKYPLAWFGLGKTLGAQKRSEPAEQAYRRTIELAPGLLEARLNLADLLLKRGDLTEAATTCSAALGDSPDMAKLYVKLGDISAKQRNYEESLKYFDLARRFAPYTHPPKVLLAVDCCSNGDLERGLTLLHEARAESPEYPVPPLILGQLAARKQQWKEAGEFFAAAASLPIPDNWPQSHRQRFGILLHSERLKLAQQLQDFDLARDALSQWIKCDPENRQLKKMYEELLASAPPKP